MGMNTLLMPINWLATLSLSCAQICDDNYMITSAICSNVTVAVAVAVTLAAARFFCCRRRLRRSKVYPVCVAVPEALAAAKYSRRRGRRRGRSKIFPLTLPGILWYYLFLPLRMPMHPVPRSNLGSFCYCLINKKGKAILFSYPHRYCWLWRQTRKDW